jgi:mannose-6-phosphate isomerase
MINIISLPPNRVWRTYLGGKSLDLVAEKDDPQDSHFPEDWIASLTSAVNPGREHFTEEGLSKVKVNGNKVLLRELIKKYPEEILGKEHYNIHGLSTSFLLKFLDSAIRLHIQCHPTIAFAKQFLNSDFGKTEGYYILGTREDVETPFIYLGFQNPPNKKKFKEAIEKQDIKFLESCFEKIPVKKGDVFYVPGGLPHAIGEGVFMIEILEPTDLVVRIEFEKGGYTLPKEARFMNKGIDFALSMFDYTPVPIETVQSKYFIKQRLISNTNFAQEFEIFDTSVTDCFRMNKLVVKGKHTLKKESFYILIVTEGVGQIKSGKESFNVKFGDKFLIPAKTDAIDIETSTSLEMILAMPPK